LKDGRVVSANANGARGYPDRPASDEELAAKFLSCARQALPSADADQALDVLRKIETSPDIRKVTDRLQPSI
jgi:hypothetical protein